MGTNSINFTGESKSTNYQSITDPNIGLATTSPTESDLSVFTVQQTHSIEEKGIWNNLWNDNLLPSLSSTFSLQSSLEERIAGGLTLLADTIVGANAINPVAWFVVGVGSFFGCYSDKSSEADSVCPPCEQLSDSEAVIAEREWLIEHGHCDPPDCSNYDGYVMNATDVEEAHEEYGNCCSQ